MTKQNETIRQTNTSLRWLWIWQFFSLNESLTESHFSDAESYRSSRLWIFYNFSVQFSPVFSLWTIVSKPILSKNLASLQHRKQWYAHLKCWHILSSRLPRCLHSQPVQIRAFFTQTRSIAAVRFTIGKWTNWEDNVRKVKKLPDLWLPNMQVFLMLFFRPLSNPRTWTY